MTPVLIGMVISMRHWYYLDAAEQQFGPYTDQELISLFNRSAIHHDTLVWHERLDDWQSLANFASELGIAKRPPPVPPSSRRVILSTSQWAAPQQTDTGAINIEAAIKWHRYLCCTVIGCFLLLIPLAVLAPQALGFAAISLVLLSIFLCYKLAINIGLSGIRWGFLGGVGCFLCWIPQLLLIDTVNKAFKEGGLKFGFWARIPALVVSLLIVTTIVAILAAIALPAFRDYEARVARTQVTNGLAAIAPLRDLIEHAQGRGQNCPSNGDGNIQSPESYASDYVSFVQAGFAGEGNCAIQLTYGGEKGGAQINGKVLILDYDPATSTWRVFSSDLPKEYLPTSLNDAASLE